MATPPEVLDFESADPAPIVDRMDELAAAGRGWINLQAIVADADLEEIERPSRLFGFLGGGGPPVPLCTWVVGSPVSIGVQHPSGPKAVARLREAGLAVPAGWRVTQDHPRRGLVVDLPGEEAHDRVLDWLLRAGTLLGTVPVTGRWRAGVYRA